MNDIVTTWLYRYPEIDSQISQLRKEITAILEDKYQVKATKAIGTSGKGNNKYDVVCSVIISCDEHVIMKQNRIVEMIRVRNAVDRTMNKLSFAQLTVLRLRYFERKEWADIAEEMCINIKRLYNIATKIKNMITEEMKNMTK